MRPVQPAYQDTVPLPRRCRGSLGEVLEAAVPFIIAAGANAIKLSCDRVMLAWHSDLAMCAALAAGATAFMAASLFIGISGYAAVFVSQYYGAGEHKKIGSVVWQSIFLSLIFGALVAVLGQVGASVFSLAGHQEELALLEAEYFRLLMGGAVFSLVSTSLMCFWIGRKKTWVVVAVNLACIGLNILLNYLLIFGWPQAGTGQAAGGSGPVPFLLPALGVKGAALATILSDAFKMAILFCLFLTPANRAFYRTLPQRLYNSAIARKLLYVGVGNGVQFLLSVGSIALFHLLIGRYASGADGVSVAVASGIAFSLNAAVFIPMIGLGSASAMLVAHGVGAGNEEYVRRVVANASLLAMLYMATVVVLFVLFPQNAIAVFSREGGLSPHTAELAMLFLYFSVVVFIADSYAILYGSAIRGAGDAHYAAKVSAVLGGLLAPFCLMAVWLGAGADVLWAIVTLYAVTKAAAYYCRYRQGVWKRMSLVGPRALPLEPRWPRALPLEPAGQGLCPWNPLGEMISPRPPQRAMGNCKRSHFA